MAGTGAPVLVKIRVLNQQVCAAVAECEVTTAVVHEHMVYREVRRAPVVKQVIRVLVLALEVAQSLELRCRIASCRWRWACPAHAPAHRSQLTTRAIDVNSK